MTEPSPRVNAPLLAQFMGRPVRVIGQITGSGQASAKMESKGEIQLECPTMTPLEPGQVYEILGKVQPNLAIKIYSSHRFERAPSELGPRDPGLTDMDHAHKLVDLCQQYKDMFY